MADANAASVVPASAGDAGTTLVETDIPARLDRLPWARWHYAGRHRARHHLDPRRARGHARRLGSARAAGEPGRSASPTPRSGSSASAYLAGAVAGALFFGRLTDRLGRKRLFLVTLGVYLVATAATALSWNFCVASRCSALLTGAGIGGEYAAINSAIDELMPARVRGRTDSRQRQLLDRRGARRRRRRVVLLDPARARARPRLARWRSASARCSASAILLLRRFLPESPRWLLMHGRVDEAERVVGRDRGERCGATSAHALPPPDRASCVRAASTLAATSRARCFATYPRRALLGARR